ncbi:SO2930 family diheme c-type cytochrome [Altererythrobacter arenosus]|uniref:SO2930 family diheme c-type cytochrome n=1 Tax=Altererythrobacter arenosus TaxID=3032592 RepID=A0ABY8FSZ8_9SPHN|nr:SO2930 family diheme c-type cytochrome [Altererythrobacter sp. CAU 1644]WFL77887.1 SO2930 family diheme c-type cytochrome [Altererythrobacter sp. CAU 1644]
MKKDWFLLLAGLTLLGAVSVRATVPHTVNDAAIMEDRLPRTLSEFGFFTDPAKQAPSPRVVPYRLNTPLFSDGAEKLRFAYVPVGQQATANGEGLIDFPVGSALIKTFAFGDGEDRRLIETRVLLRRADGWVALPYQWNDEQTEAKLVVAGARLPVTTPWGETISYRVPNKNQCKECHGLDGQVVLIGPKARNLSSEWLDQYVALGMLDQAPELATRLPLWEERSETPTEAAARGYLDVNCAHCHRPGATASNSGLDLRWEQDDPHAIGIFKRPVAAGRGAGGHEFSIVPGEPDNSILAYRMGSLEPGVAMPEMGKGTIDKDGVEIVRRWIAEMKR